VAVVVAMEIEAHMVVVQAVREAPAAEAMETV
jgi:hypothetical protein